MPVNWGQIHGDLKSYGRSLGAQAEALNDAQESVLASLEKYAADPQIAQRIEAVVSGADPNLRCAVPTAEGLNVAWDPGSAPPKQIVIAADGSQVTPDRHDQLLFGVVNIGTVILRMHSGQAPTVTTDTKLLFGERLYAKNGDSMTEGDIALLRDRAERASLLKSAQEIAEPAITLTDGPLELWGAKDVSEPGAFDDALRTYLADLTELKRLSCTVAGYVDKPAADLVVRLFEILETSNDKRDLRSFRPFRGVTDRWLFGSLLGPGQRSAVFALQSSSRARYGGDLSIHFFYLNMGTVGHPAIARIEVPEWIGTDPGRLGALHAVLLDQCAQLGARPYPYILHRAHETARITESEKAEIRHRLLLDLYASGFPPEDVSGKASAKMSSDAKGRY